MLKWQCSLCGFIYLESKGLPGYGIPKETLWKDIPPEWYCPYCGGSKHRFKILVPFVVWVYDLVQLIFNQAAPSVKAEVSGGIIS